MGQPSLPKKKTNSSVRRKFSQHVFSYISADKSLARPGTKQANVSVRMAWISYGALPCRKRNLMTARLDVVEIAGVPVMLPSLFLSCSG